MTLDQIRAQLKDGADALGINLNDNQTKLLCEYLSLLEKWNKAYNLTAIRDPKSMLSLHLLDSLAIVPLVQGKTLIDVGTGAGLPGIVLAITKPSTNITLLDSNGKKTRFLVQAASELGLQNIQVVNTRVETYQPEKKYEGVLSRAFATLKDMADNAAHLLGDDGRFWAMKGRFPQSELDQLGSTYHVEASYELNVPGVAAERHLIEMSRSKVSLD